MNILRFQVKALLRIRFSGAGQHVELRDTIMQGSNFPSSVFVVTLMEVLGNLIRLIVTWFAEMVLIFVEVVGEIMYIHLSDKINGKFELG